MKLLMAGALALGLAASAQGANFTYKLGDHEVDLGYPHGRESLFPHRVPSVADGNFLDMKARYKLFLEEGLKCLQRGLKAAAVEDLTHAVAIEPYQPYARRLLAHALFGARDYKGALLQLRRAAHLSQNFQRLDIEWKKLCSSQCDYEADLTALRSACAACPEDPVPHMLLAIYRYFDEDYKEAEPLFARATVLCPTDPEAIYFLNACKHRRR